MTLISTPGARRLGLLALVALTTGWLGCGGSSSGNGPGQVQDAISASKTAKDNYLKSRAERKAQNPGPARAAGRR